MKRRVAATDWLLATLGRGLLLAALWWTLTDGRTYAWGVGAASVALALLASLHLLPPASKPLSLLGCLAFAGFFLRHSIQGGLQVAAQALRPRLDIEPALLDLPLTLAPGAARVLLLCTLSLLPGTLSVRVLGDTLRLHALDRRLAVREEMRAAEAAVARIWRSST